MSGLAHGRREKRDGSLLSACANAKNRFRLLVSAKIEFGRNARRSGIKPHGAFGASKSDDFAIAIDLLNRHAPVVALRRYACASKLERWQFGTNPRTRSRNAAARREGSDDCTVDTAAR